ncbi:MAG: DUF2478 domain-containing protein [Bacteroidales bacterium]|nr:DUF2478 domain-containing protein [Bacteroidales bacterium]
MSEASQQHTIFLVTGSVQGGKTTFLSELVDLLKKRGLKVGGFLSPGSFDSGERSGFKLKNIATGMELPMASAQETGEWIKYRRFWFNPDAFKQGFEWIQACLVQEPHVVVIDEVGPMELNGSGWLEGLESLRTSSVPIQIWSVRERLLSEVLERWDVPSENVIRIEEVEAIGAAELISGIVKKK